MLEKLKALELRYEDLQNQLGDPKVYSDSERLRQVNRELKELSPIAETYRAYIAADSCKKESEELLHDPDLKEMAQEELLEAKAELESLKEKLTILLLPKDPDDGRNVVLEIRAGTGGEEAALFAHSLLRMYTMYAESRGWKLEIASINETELGGVKDCSAVIEGEDVYSRLKFESGTHRVQRVPVTESNGKLQTSAATVAVLPEMEPVDVELNPADIEMQVYRSSGAGGQHINKTSSAVRLIHKPTGIVVASQQERSQFQNKDNCMKQLRAKLIELKIQQHAEKISDIKGVQMKIEWGSQIRSYVFMPYQLVKDTRTGYETSQIDNVMDGDLDGFLNAYLTQLATGELKK